MKHYMVLTPKRRPLKIEVDNGTRLDDLKRILCKRIAPSPGRVPRELTMKEDGDFLAGVEAAFGLDYARRVRDMVCESDSVEISFVEE